MATKFIGSKTSESRAIKRRSRILRGNSCCRGGGLPSEAPAADDRACTGRKTEFELHCDSSSARALTQNRGFGGTSHIAFLQLLQSAVETFNFNIEAISGTRNPPDPSTKSFKKAKIIELFQNGLLCRRCKLEETSLRKLMAQHGGLCT